MTPRVRDSLSTFMIPWVAATAACDGLRPVANAFGDGSGIMYTFGIGSPARCASRAVIWCSGCSGPTGLRAIHAEDDLVREPVRPEVHDQGKEERHHQAVRPPTSSPITSSRPLSAPRSRRCFQSIAISLFYLLIRWHQRRQKRRAPWKVRDDDMLVQRVSAVPFRAEAI